MSELHAELRNMFEDMREEGGMTLASMVTWCKECNLLDKKLTIPQVGLIFTSVVVGKKKSLHFDRFQEAVRKVAIAKGNTYQEVIQLACGQQACSQIVSEAELKPKLPARKQSLTPLASEETTTPKRFSQLSDIEFQNTFGMNKDDYDTLAGWKQVSLKKKHELLAGGNASGSCTAP
jgi:hypothetical protein